MIISPECAGPNCPPDVKKKKKKSNVFIDAKENLVLHIVKV